MQAVGETATNGAGSGSFSLAFAAAARAMGEPIRKQGLLMPGFRAPTRVVGQRRTICRHKDGSATVSVQLRNRPWVAVLADMVEGVVAVNQLDSAAAGQLRDELWERVEAQVVHQYQDAA